MPTEWTMWKEDDIIEQVNFVLYALGQSQLPWAGETLHAKQTYHEKTV